MKTLLFSVFFLGIAMHGYGQAVFAPDTIFFQNFEVDPSDEMLPFPSGNDLLWVNFNQDGGQTTCAQNGGTTPGDWYQESDLGTNEPTDNDAFTSCSYRGGILLQNRNWLITPPIFISDPTSFLSWKSLAVQGPLYTDGYKVLVSTGSNDPASGSYDTVFLAAQMLATDSAGSLSLSHYTFSPGYIQANGFTDTNYYFIDTTQLDDGSLALYFHGRLEPHQLSLSAYVGQSVYIAFLHDSKDDYILQIDDIAIVKQTLGVDNPNSGITAFSLRPNPVSDFAQISWTLESPQPLRLDVLNCSGQVLFQQQMATSPVALDLSGYAPGAYFLRVQTSKGQLIQRFIKI